MITSSHNEEIITAPSATPEEQLLEEGLRPKNFSEYIGQNSLKASLQIVMDAATQRKEQIEHLLFYGPPGLGKTTLAGIIARELGTNLKTTSGPAITRAGDLASILTNLEPGGVLFIDEIHRLNRAIEEVLYPALEDRALDIMLGKGVGARSIRMELPPFTLIGATTRIGLISGPLRDRFGAIYHLDYYNEDELEQIIHRSAKILRTKIDSEATKLLATRSRMTPRIANRLLKRARDFAQVNGHDTISETSVTTTLKLLEVDDLGLDKNDRRLLEVIIDKFSGGPVGLSTLAAATSEEQDAITDVYEPFLIRQGLLTRTAKGRLATDRAYQHLGKSKLGQTLL